MEESLDLVSILLRSRYWKHVVIQTGAPVVSHSLFDERKLWKLQIVYSAALFSLNVASIRSTYFSFPSFFFGLLMNSLRHFH